MKFIVIIKNCKKNLTNYEYLPRQILKKCQKKSALIRIFLNIPYDEIKDRVEILNNQKIRRSKKEN